MRFPTLYTFPPLYTQKPAARRVFVFVGDFLLWESMPEKKKSHFPWGIGTKSGFMKGKLICGE
jgi:hypothetical protein